MKRFRHNLVVGSAVAMVALALTQTGCALTESPSKGLYKSKVPQQSQSFWSKVNPFGKSTNTANPSVITVPTPQAAADDPVSLSSTAKPGPNLYVAMAQLKEREDDDASAEKQYKLALKSAPDHLPALLGYARLQDRKGKLDAATKLYQKAAAKHPDDATAHNDLGLCYHRRGMLNEATESLAKAVELQPDRKLYRNNLASVYVEQGLYDDALSHLAAANGEAVGHYNLGYMLNQKGDRAAALQHFQQSLQQDPSLTAAHQWIASLSQPGTNPYVAYGTRPTGVTPSQPVTPALRTAESVAMLQRGSQSDPLAPGPSASVAQSPHPGAAVTRPPARPDYQPAVRYPVGEVPAPSASAALPAPDQAQGSASVQSGVAEESQTPSPTALY